MKKIAIFLTMVLVTLSANAQSVSNGETQLLSGEEVITGPEGQHIIIDHNSYAWRPFDDAMGYSVYGSRYRRAKAMQEWGVILSVVVAPLAGVLVAYSIKQNIKGGAVAGGIVTAASLGAGIPLWIKGRRDLDWMLDDYTKRYAPKPYGSSLTVGPTMNGMGLAFNF